MSATELLRKIEEFKIEQTPKIQSKKLRKLTTDQLMEVFKISEPTEEEIQEDILRRSLMAKIRNKVFYENNKDKIYARRQEKEKTNPELFKQKTKEYTKKYYEKNSNMIECVCGSKFKAISNTRHLSSDKHLKYLSALLEKGEPQNIIEESKPIL